MSNDHLRNALRTLILDLPGWLEAGKGGEALSRGIAHLEGYQLELNWLRSVERPEPWQQERRRLLEHGADADRERLTELLEKRQRHEVTTERLLRAERIISHFAGRHGINTASLTQLLMGQVERFADGVEDPAGDEAGEGMPHQARKGKVL
jgi:hypothetical protein